jgi:hypothetical protein
MSLVVIRQQLEVAVAAALGSVKGVYENETYVPVAGVPHAQVNILFGEPLNPTFGDGFYREVGFVQILLRYPMKTGSGAANAAAQAIREAFPRGRTFVTGGVTTVISGTANALPSNEADDRFVLPVRVPFYSNVFA